MAKRCNYCGFTQNPDDATCCGKCGVCIANGPSRGYAGTSRIRTYDSYVYRCVTNERFKELIRAESQLKELRQKQSKSFGTWLKNVVDWEAVFGIITLGVVGIGLTIGICYLFAWACSSKKLQAIEVDGKYGIGYSVDELLVEAKYDSISERPYGNYWSLFDHTTGNIGLAYVTDSITNVLEPTYSRTLRGDSHYALLRASAKNENQEAPYEFIAYDGVLYNADPYVSVKQLGSINDPTLFVAKKAYNKAMLLKPDLSLAADTFKYVSVYEPDSVIVATLEYSSYPYPERLYDFNGEPLNMANFYMVQDFSDGVAWCYTSLDDRKNNRWTLIDRKGTTQFRIYADKYTDPKAFTDGIAWVKERGSKKWAAIDKQGIKRFETEARYVYPFTMGLAPVSMDYYGKLGFIDKNGKTVYPFKYECKYSNPHFSPYDSLMSGIKLNGVEGRLHRNGTFIPDK